MMKIQVAIFTTSGDLEKEVNDFLSTLDPDMFVDIRYIPGSDSPHRFSDSERYPQAMVIYKTI